MLPTPPLQQYQCPSLAEVYRVSEARIIREIVELSKSVNAAKESTTK